MAYVFSNDLNLVEQNLTYGYADDNAPPMVFQTFEPEPVDSVEFGLKQTCLMKRKSKHRSFHMTMKIYNSSN